MYVNMPKFLLVEDNTMWQDILQSEMGKIVDGNVDLAVDYAAALRFVQSAPYEGYVLDGSFPRAPGGAPEKLGIVLAQDIQRQGVGLDKIVMMSSGPILEEARKLGIGAYTKEPESMPGLRTHLRSLLEH